MFIIFCLILKFLLQPKNNYFFCKNWLVAKDRKKREVSKAQMSSTNLEKILNLTPHTIVLQFLKDNSKGDDKIEEKVEFHPSGIVARCTGNESCQKLQGSSELYGIPIYGRLGFTGVQGLPEDKSIPIIVSEMVARYISENSVDEHARLQVFYPDTGPESAIRNEKGEIIAVKRLLKY